MLIFSHSHLHGFIPVVTIMLEICFLGGMTEGCEPQLKEGVYGCAQPGVNTDCPEGWYCRLGERAPNELRCYSKSGSNVGDKDTVDEQRDAGDSSTVNPGDASAVDSSSDGPIGNDASTCRSGELRCDGSCVANDEKHCGSCGHDCTLLSHVSGPVDCVAATCVLTEYSCASGWSHCSSDPDDGCETDLSKDDNCGACGVQCPESEPYCAPRAGSNAEQPEYECATGCSTDAPIQCGTSCVDIESNPLHCGECDNECETPRHATVFCDGGDCDFNCTSSEYLKCENECVPNDVNNCGECGNDCTELTTESCATFVCSDNSCVEEVESGCCLIDGECYDNGDENPSNVCQYCDSGEPKAWSNRSSGYSCGDGQYCNGAETCDGNGFCSPGTNPCASGGPCNECTESTHTCQNTTTWYDDGSGLSWEVTPASETKYCEEAISYCASLDLCGRDDWRLPSISELRSLARNCSGSETGGDCGVTDSCADSSCITAECGGCNTTACAWPAQISGMCDIRYWSSTHLTDSPESCWDFGFDSGGGIWWHGGYLQRFRCVRSGM